MIPVSICNSWWPSCTDGVIFYPVYDAYWISSKTGNLCASVSTDGQLLWQVDMAFSEYYACIIPLSLSRWDVRRLREPYEILELNTGAKHAHMPNTRLGGSSMEYNQEAGPTKYLVGTEQGVVMSINSRNIGTPKGAISVFDTQAGRHHGAWSIV